MADQNFDDFGAYSFVQGRAGRMTHLAGGVISVALVIGMAVWGYKLAVRDVAGIPVVRALEGPMRIAPEAPGGEVAPHQGLAVNDVAALGSATPLPEALTLAPRTAELAAEDGPGLGMTPVEEQASLLTASAGLDDPATLALPEATLTPEAIDAALAEALTPEKMAFAESDLLDASAPMRSLRPRPRPGSPASAPVTDVQDIAAVALPAVALPAVDLPAVDPATLTIGTPLVQLGTFNTEDEARVEWARLSVRFGDLMAAKAVVLQPARSGGSTFIRLRAHGFADEDDARRFCTALLSEDAACVPTAHR